MADNVVANAGAGGATFRTDDDGTAHWPYTKLAWGADNTQTIVAAGASAIPIQDGGNAITVDGTVTANLAAGTNNIGDIDVLSIAAGDNNIGNVDIVSFPAEAHSTDFDTGAGTDTTLAFGIAVPAAGGAAVIPGDATAGLKVDLGADNDVTVTGTVTANLAAGTNNIGDVDVLTIAAGDNNIGNVDIVTVPAPLSTTGGGVEATALRVTIASDSTGVVSVDDNGGALTVDGTVTASQGTAANLQVRTVRAVSSVRRQTNRCFVPIRYRRRATVIWCFPIRITPVGKSK